MNACAATLAEGCLVLVAGVGLGLLVNALDPRGLDLCRDHFPGAAAPAPADDRAQGVEAVDATGPGPAPASAGGDATPAVHAAGTGPPALSMDAIDPAVVERLRSKGLQPLGLQDAEAWWRDPLFTHEAYVFVDARDDEHYAAGHIPGAWPFDPFRPELHIDALLPLLPGTERLVIYCNGGECEDSESAALTLLGYGADTSRMWIFAGGMSAWREAGLDVERGARLSGELEQHHDG